jgi:hypothetical protein
MSEPIDPATEDLRRRYLALYTGAIADMLDKHGLRQQVLPYFVTPFTKANRLAGVAFTGQGYPCAAATNNDTESRLAMLDSITPGTISVWAWQAPSAAGISASGRSRCA